MHQTYIKKWLLFVLILAIPVLANWLFLFNCGELTPITKIVDKQLSAPVDTIVGLATRNQSYYYKKHMVLQSKPRVLVLGSSRVMQFKQRLFNRSMINAGGGMNHINEGFSFIHDVLSVYTPEVVILGVDYWWFNDQAIEASTEIAPPQELSHRISMRSYLLPFKWLWQQKLTWSEYVSNLNPLYMLNEHNNRHIGVDGLFNQNGYAKDGSYVYTKTVVGKEKNRDEGFALSLDAIHQGGSRFEYGQEVNSLHWQNFMAMVKHIQSRGVKVILFMPPLAPRVLEEIEHYPAQYAYIQSLIRKLKDAPVDFYDFHNPAVLSTNDCEFIDGIHGGDIVYAKILLKMAQGEPALMNTLDQKRVAHYVQAFPNLSAFPNQYHASQEVDFLKIGCDKSAQYQFHDVPVGA